MRNIKLIIVSTCALYLSACESFRDYEGTPDITGAAQTDLMQNANDRFSPTAPITAWWETLNDDQLNQLIQTSLNNNKDVGIALANLSEARSIAREAGFDRYPRVTADGDFRRSRSSGQLGLGESQVTNNYEAGFDASWELDFFGQVSESIKASAARARSAQESLRDVYVTVASEVARTYIELRGSQYQLDIAKRNAKNQNDTYQITRKLVDAGRVIPIDVSRAQAQFELTKSTIPTFEAAVTANINRLSVLTGQVPDSLHAALSTFQPLPNIPASINVGNVSDLLRRRPDIAAAEQNLIAAVADYNVSVAEQFPQVNITGALGFAATSLSNFGSSALIASTGPNVSWSAFDLGRVKARISQNDARAQIALITYEKTVLEALEDLQTAVSDFSKEEVRRGSLQAAARASAEAARLAAFRYEAGADTFLDVLGSQETKLEAEATLAESEINAAIDLISIYKALGGGWQIKASAL